MITRTDVEILRQQFATVDRPVLSIYLDVDQSNAANLRRLYEAALDTRLRALESTVAAADHDAFHASAAHVREHVGRYQPHAKTLILFADESAILWSGELRTSLPSEARWQPRPYLRPLLEALDEHPPYAVALVDKEAARVFVVALGEVEEERGATASAEVRHKNASGTDHWRSQMHFQRQDDMHVHWHMREVADLLAEIVRTHGVRRIVLAGPVEATGELARVLPRPLDGYVAGTIRLAFDTPAEGVLRETATVAAQAERDAEMSHVAQAIDQAAVGVGPVLDALHGGRVMTLLYSDDFAAGGAECPRCHALFAGNGGPCAYCGERLRPLDDLVTRAVERAGESGAGIDKVHGEAAVRLRTNGGGIGALLRF